MNFGSIISGPTVYVKIYCTIRYNTKAQQKKSILRLSDRVVDSRWDCIELHHIYLCL